MQCIMIFQIDKTKREIMHYFIRVVHFLTTRLDFQPQDYISLQIRHLCKNLVEIGWVLEQR